MATATTTWVLHDCRLDSTIHKADYNGCEIFRIRDNNRIWNDSFLVMRDGVSLGDRASISAAKKLADR